MDPNAPRSPHRSLIRADLFDNDGARRIAGTVGEFKALIRPTEDRIAQDPCAYPAVPGTPYRAAAVPCDDLPLLVVYYRVTESACILEWIGAGRDWE